MLFTSHSGFLPGGDAIRNTELLNRLLTENGDVTVDAPGVYDLTGPVFLNSHNHLTFAPGTTVRRVPAPDGFNCNLFINRGAFTGAYDEDISLAGLHLVTNRVEHSAPTPARSETISGLRGHVAFLYIRGLLISDMIVTDLSPCDYAIQVSDFENVRIERIHAEGLKDGVHFGPGHGFVLRDCAFRTYDDDIALNCSDYSVSNPNLGTIEDGLIENITDLPGQKTDSFFLRFLVGSPRPWTKGMQVWHSDAVVNDGKMYRVVMSPDNKCYTSLTPPTHETGFAMHDGITWVRTNLGYTEEELLKPACCRNIVCRNVYMEQPRELAMLMYMDNSEFLRSYHEGSPVPEITGIVFENLQVLKPIAHLLDCWTKIGDVTFKNCDLGGADIRIEKNKLLGDYPDPDLRFENTEHRITRK